MSSCGARRSSSWLPPGFFVAGQRGHLGQMLAQSRVPGFEKREKLVANAVAGIGQVAIGGVFAPGLAQFAEIGLDFCARGGKERAQDRAFRGFKLWSDAGKALGPRATQEFGEDCLGLVVEGVRGGYCVERGFGDELAEPLVAEAAGGFFDGLGGFAGCGVGLGLRSHIDARLMEGQAETGGEVAGKDQIGVGLFAAQAVVEVGGMKHEAKLGAASGKNAQEGHRVRATGEAYGEAQAWL